MPSAGLAITPYKTKNVYVPMDTHRLQTPPPQRTSVSRARAACGCVRVCPHCARVNYTRGRARAPNARTARAHCTCSPYARAVREPYARTVRKKCAPKSAAFFQNLLPFVENLLRFFNICCHFLHVRSTRVVAVRYGARTRVRCVRFRAGARNVRAVRARSVRTHRARALYVPYANRTRTVRPDCTQKVCAKNCCVLFKICCVFFQNLL